MRHFTRLLIALLTFTIGLTAVAVRSVFQPSPLSDEPVSLGDAPIEFFGWRRETPTAVRDRREKEALPSSTYSELEIWNAADESQPQQVDVVYRLENLGSRSIDLMVLAVCDFSISPDGQRAGSKELLRNPTLQTERQNIGQQVVRGLRPGETREIRFTDFNLGMMADKYLRKEYGTLRPSELRVNIDVRTLDNRQVAQQQGRLLLTLGR